MSNHLALPLEGNREQVLDIFRYLKIHKKMVLLFDCSYPIISSNLFKEYYWINFYRYSKEDIPPNMTKVRGN